MERCSKIVYSYNVKITPKLSFTNKNLKHKYSQFEIFTTAALFTNK